MILITIQFHLLLFKWDKQLVESWSSWLDNIFSSSGFASGGHRSFPSPYLKMSGAQPRVTTGCLFIFPAGTNLPRLHVCSDGQLFFHSRVMEATGFLGSFSASGFVFVAFCGLCPDLWRWSVTAVRNQDELLTPTVGTYAGTLRPGYLSVHDRRLETVSISWMMKSSSPIPQT